MNCKVVEWGWIEKESSWTKPAKGVSQDKTVYFKLDQLLLLFYLKKNGTGMWHIISQNGNSPTQE